MLIVTPYDDLTELIIGKAITVHDDFGPGLLESVYKKCVALLLVEAGLIVEVEKPLPVRFRGLTFDHGYRVDLIVEEKVIVEVKAIEMIAPVHVAQMMTYLKLAGCPVGLILNFNVASLRHGVRRVLNKEVLDGWSKKDREKQNDGGAEGTTT